MSQKPRLRLASNLKPKTQTFTLWMESET